VTDTAVVPAELAAPADGPPLASWARRVIAALLDGAILGGATWIVLGSRESEPSLTPTFAVGAASDLDTGAWFTSPWLVGLLLAMLAVQGWTGATPGKRVAGVAVVRISDSLPIGLLASAGRVVAHLLDAILLIGYLRPLWNGRKQTFADSIVGTLAVQTREPPAHPWFARFRREPSALRSTVVTVASFALCVLGFAFSSTQTSAGFEHETDVPCVAGVQSPTASVEATRHVQTFLDRRLWVTRSSVEPAQTALSITWTWVHADLSTARRAHEIDILDADGEVVSVIEQELPFDSPAVLDPLRITPFDLSGGGPGWTVESRLVADGVTVASCTVSQDDWDAIRPG
jgi:Mce-associated membrane protein